MTDSLFFETLFSNSICLDKFNCSKECDEQQIGALSKGTHNEVEELEGLKDEERRIDGHVPDGEDEIGSLLIILDFSEAIVSANNEKLTCKEPGLKDAGESKKE